MHVVECAEEFSKLRFGKHILASLLSMALLSVAWAQAPATDMQVPPGEHAFMRDEGARYDPEMADRVFAEAIALYRRALV